MILLLGTKGSITINIPFNAPTNKETKIWLKENDKSEREITLPAVNQYTLQAEAFCNLFFRGLPCTSAIGGCG